MENLLNEVNEEVKDIFKYNIETTNAYVVPSRNDQGLTFPMGDVKKGKLIETCVLFVDIRNSTKISRDLKKDKVKLGKVYSSFIHAMTSIADEYGYVRNIIGDRVMVVFEPNDCFKNAITCAAVMNAVTIKMLRKYSAIETFKAGIGIDFGEMLVLKTGIHKKNNEQSEYKGLVWVGDAANISSKLADFAGKEYNSPLYNITYEYMDLQRIFKGYKPKSNPYGGLASLLNPPQFEEDYEVKWEKKSTTVSISPDEFNSKMEFSGEIKYDGKKVTHIGKENRNGTASSILMTAKVYDEYKKAEPKGTFLASISKRSYPGLPYVAGGIYGGYLTVPEINKIKLD